MGGCWAATTFLAGESMRYPPDHHCERFLPQVNIGHVKDVHYILLLFVLVLRIMSPFIGRPEESTPRRIKGPINEHCLIYNRNNKSSRKDRRRGRRLTNPHRS